MSLQEKLENEITAYNELIEAIGELDEQRRTRLGRIQMLQELVAEQQSKEAKPPDD